MTRSNFAPLQTASGLDNERRVRLLGIIDKLRELGINDNVSLPQLVVIGDQSSGKSSLLEGLTGMSFPVASDLCTRFATQIVLRRAAKEDAGVRITIIPGPIAQANDDLRERLLGFERRLPAGSFGSSEFEAIFDEAALHMGVPGPSTVDLEGLDKRFSDDILKIELTGPEHRHLSVVDVPGLFHNPTKYQTLEDRAIIRNLIERYITDKRTIILAVMDARNNLANQEVFTMARDADPQGSRTVGIITKCDAVQPGDEQGVIKIAQNQVERLTHGWFAVRNRSTQEIKDGIDLDGRHHRERHFFSTAAPWNELRKDRVGISALKEFLGVLLYNHIKEEFPGMVKEIEELSHQTQEELDLLGPSRQTSSDQRRYLTRIAARYQQHVAGSLSGNYDPELDSDSPLKLRMHIRNLNDQFAHDMARYGHSKMFKTIDGNVDQEYARNTGDNQDIYDWIRLLYRDSRGAELPGTVNPVVLENMFRQQSSPWDTIARSYIENVCDAVIAYNKRVLPIFIGDDEIRGKVAAILRATEEQAATNANEQLLTILRDEREGILQTVNHYFADTLASIREERVLARLRSMGFEDAVVHDVTEIAKGVHLSNEDQAVNDIHDILKAYYKVAMKRFTDNVVLQVTERCILGHNGAVRALSPEIIGDMSDRVLEDIAGENYATSSTRNELASKIERFQTALRIAKQEGI